MGIFTMIMKRSRSGKQLQVVLTEDMPAGTVFVCASSIVSSVLSGAKPFISLNMYPNPSNPDKFPKAKVVIPGEGYKTISIEEARERGLLPDAPANKNTDALDSRNVNKKDDKIMFSGDTDEEWFD